MKLVDLFCGCGGMSLGFQNAGFQIKAAFDNWDAAIKIYSHNFSHPIYKVDLSKEDITENLKSIAPDIIIGGPPCQDFSIAGKRNFLGDRANLTRVFANLVVEIRPTWFVMENVYNIEKSPIFHEVLQTFSNAGYGITKHIWDASYMGVPQMRRRYIVIGQLNAPDDFMLDLLISRLSKSRMTLREYFKENPLDTEYVYLHPRSYLRRAVFSLDEPCNTIRSINRTMPNNYIFHPADKCTDRSKIRSLTTIERGMVQSFPLSFSFIGNTSDIEKAIGNAVPVKMAEFIASAIMEYAKLNPSKHQANGNGD